MSDTRAAIRELRSLSEKRSLSPLTEAEAARWMVLRRQLGLPLEPPNPVPLASAPGEWTAAPTPPPAAAAASPLPTLDAAEESLTAPQQKPSSAVEDVAFDAPVLADAGPAEEWRGPSIDSPAARAPSAWGGPALDAPAWSDAAAERPTDPGLDEPPPTPFDEAPAAGPDARTVAPELSGDPDERLPVAAAAEFISYSRDGDEGIDVPTDTGAADALEHRGLAELAGMAPGGGAPSEAGSVEATDPLDWMREPSAEPTSEATADSAAAESGGALLLPAVPLELASVLPEPPVPEMEVSSAPPLPLQVEAAAPAPDDSNEGVLLEPPSADGLEFQGEESLHGQEGVVPEPAALQLETLAPTPLPLTDTEQSLAAAQSEGVVAEAPFRFESDPQPSLADAQSEGVVAEAPFRFEPDPQPSLALGEDEGAVRLLSSNEGPSDGAPAPFDDSELAPEEADHGASGELPPTPPAVSTWAPGAAEPPVLGTDDFAASGESLTEGGLDPWPEELPSAAQQEEVIETVSDEDFVEDLSTPTPLPAFPSGVPTGSGGIRGFQFPRPPATVPTPPVPPAWQRTPPTTPAPQAPRPAATPSPVSPASGAPKTPAPPGPLQTATARSVPTPVPAAPSALPTLKLEPPEPWEPGTPRAVAPVTPPPAPRASVLAPPAPAAPRTPVPAPAAPRTPLPAAATLRTPVPTAVAPRTPVPVAPRAAPTLHPAAEDESGLPLLELVDEVGAAPAPAPARARPALTKPVPSGPADVFGPPMMLNPSFVEGEHRVVIHTLEGQVHRGVVHDLDLHDDGLSVLQPDGRTVRVPSKRVKAVFFVLAPGGQPLPTRGERVQVTFRDGRQVVGYSDDHASGDPGFFVVPSDARTNTARVYVFRGGVQSITTG